ncbi:DHHW family protein [Clostridium paraputrificum]|uniref:DHHW family protein n=1 Tax=Clostridium TaxID=1485 RepID=UPI003D32BC2F
MKIHKIEKQSRYLVKKKKKVKKYEKANNILLAMIFIGLIFSITLVGSIKKDKDFSEQENRKLSMKPKFTLKSFVNGEYTEDYSNYKSDQFPGRSRFVSIKAKFDDVFGKNRSNGVYIGEDNQLIEQFQEASEEETKEKIEAINNFSKRYSNLDTTFMLVPTAGKVLEEKLPKYAIMDDQLEYMDKIKGGLNSNIKYINPYEDLYKNKDNYMYYKTDHHWTSKGAYIGYRKFCRDLGLVAKEEKDFTIEKVSDSFYGSLSSKIGTISGEGDEVEVYIPKDEKFVVSYVEEQEKATSLFDSDALKQKDKYEVFTGGNHPLINIKTLGNPEKKLLIIKDSYANSFLPFLNSHYGQISVVDLRYYTDDIDKLMESEEITDIVFLYNVNTFNQDGSILNLNN